MSYDWTGYRNDGHAFLVQFVRAADRVRKRADLFFRRQGLSIAQFNVLAILMGEPAGVPQSSIVDRLVVSRANITLLVRRLAAAGWVARGRRPGDERVKIVRITRSGRSVVRRIEEAYFDEIDRLCGGVPERELQRALRLVERLTRSL